MPIPQDAEQVRDWLGRLGLSHMRAGQALGIRDANRSMRDYCNPDSGSEPTTTTRFHMALLETCVQAHDMLREGRNAQAQALLWDALAERLGADFERRNASEVASER